MTKGETRGMVLGDYVVLDRLGEGGMGQVFKAQHRRMDRIVALKVVSAAAMKDAGAVKRFQREVKAAARLTHANIVNSFDAGEQVGINFLVMEFVEGQDLSSLIKDRGPIDVATAVRYLQQAAAGLAFAHSEGVVHRDIKPGNLLLDAKGTIKILDMGLARLDDPLGQATDDGLTHSGQIMGTVDYMAPEQALNTRDAGPAADIYGLGCTFYRMLTGEPVFAGATVMQKLLAHRERPIPSLRQARSDVPEAIDAIYQRTLAKNPADRPTASQLVADLEAWRSSAPASTQVTVSLDTSEISARTSSEGGGVTTAMGDRHLRDDEAPRTDINLQAPLPQTAISSRGGKRISTRTLIGAAGAAAIVMMGIVIIVRDNKGKIVAKVHAPDGQTAEVIQDTDRQPAAPPDTPSKDFGKAAVKEGLPVASPLDALRRENIPAEALKLAGGGDPAKAPPELVAILGDIQEKWDREHVMMFNPRHQTVVSSLL